MNDAQSSLNASFWVMIFLQTLGSFDPMPGSGPRKMPSPKAYVTTLIVWSGLQLGSDLGYEDGASKFGWLVVLASMVLGPFGSRVAKLFTSISQIYGTPGSNGSTTASGAVSTQTQPESVA